MSYSYDAASRRTGMTVAGHPTTITDALGNSAQLGYTLGDVTSATDPLARASKGWADAAGRRIRAVGPPGRGGGVGV